MTAHLVQMAVAGEVVLAGSAAFEVPMGAALPYALFLACPAGHHITPQDAAARVTWPTSRAAGWSPGGPRE